MKRMLEHPPLYAVVTALAQAAMGLPLLSNRAIIIAFPTPMRWRGLALLMKSSNDSACLIHEDFRNWIALLTTPLIGWPLPLPQELQIDAALITNEGSPTPRAAWRAARAGDETIG